MGSFKFRGNIIGQTMTLSSVCTAPKGLTVSSQSVLTKAVTCSSALTVSRTLTASSAATFTKQATFSSGYLHAVQDVVSTATALNGFGVVTLTPTTTKKYRITPTPKAGQKLLLYKTMTASTKRTTVFAMASASSSICFVSATGVTKGAINFAQKGEFALCMGLSTTRWLVIKNQGLVAADFTSS